MHELHKSPTTTMELRRKGEWFVGRENQIYEIPFSELCFYFSFFFLQAHNSLSP